MESERVALIRPAMTFEGEFCAMVEEYRRVGECYDRFLEPLLDDFPAYLRRVEDFARGVSIPVGHVPQTTFWLVRDGASIVAMGRVRHRLTRALEKEGGHISYTVRPGSRRKGYGTLLCALLVEEAKKLVGVPQVLITCDTDNVGSARIIRKNGGIFAGELISDFSGKPVSRYWVPLR